MTEIDHKSAAQSACGVSFNPGARADVAQMKALFADVFERVEKSAPADDGTNATARKRKMRDAALAAIVTAQMWAVKVITLD